jgi:hypothetical protein
MRVRFVVHELLLMETTTTTATSTTTRRKKMNLWCFFNGRYLGSCKQYEKSEGTIQWLQLPHIHQLLRGNNYKLGKIKSMINFPFGER